MKSFESKAKEWLEEDFAWDDATSIGCIDPTLHASAIILLKQDGVIAGLDCMKQVFLERDSDLTVQLLAQDGKKYPAKTTLARIAGSARSILSAERTALNLLQHLSGIATLSAKCVEEVRGTGCKILDTRKTLPGYRALQKYAVKMGEARNHRLHLADKILIKNNHIALHPGGLAGCIASLRALDPDRWIQVEVKTIEEFRTALALSIPAILLDNMTPELIEQCAKENQARAFLEASGGIALSNLRAYAKTGVNAVSIGALTHSAPALDISLRVE